MKKEEILEETTIRNCKFAFKCTKKWEELVKTENKSIRFCGDCERDVHFCRTDAELTKAIKFNECIAIIDPESGEQLLGDVCPPLDYS